MQLTALLAAFFATFAAAAPAQRAEHAAPVMYNGMNVTFNYDGIILGDSSQFGLVLSTADAAKPTNLLQAPLEGPRVIGIDDEDLIDATYVLQYPFFNPNHTYKVQLVEYNTTSFDIIRSGLKEKTFIWVNRPGKSD